MTDDTRKLEEELKPCPFCGSEPEYVQERVGNDAYRDWVSCRKCWGAVHTHAPAKPGETIKRWNTRHEVSND